MSKLPPNPYAERPQDHSLPPLRDSENSLAAEPGPALRLHSPVVLYAVASVSTLLAAGAVWGVIVLRNDQTWPLLLAGLIVGGALRLLPPHTYAGLIAVIATILACAGGFVLGDLWLPWQPPSTLGVALDKMLSLQFIVLTLVAVSAAHWIATLGRET